MAIGALLGSTGASEGFGLAKTILDNSLGRPFDLWTRTVNARNDAQVRIGAYDGNKLRPTNLPSPDALISAWRRGLLPADLAARCLAYQGVMPPTEVQAVLNAEDSPVMDDIGISLPNPPARRAVLGRLWSNVSYMGMQRPSAGDVAGLITRRRITSGQFSELRHGLDVSWDQFATVNAANYSSPDFPDLLRLLRLGRITPADYRLWSARAGWTNASARTLAARTPALPTLGEAFVASWRGAISPSQLDRYALAMGYVDHTDWAAVVAANRPMPGPGDLVRFAVRDVWDAPTVAEWGYDADFPPEFGYWMKWQGMDWGAPVPMPDGTTRPAIPWPLAYWRAHWQIMSPTQAYQARRVLRPDRIGRHLLRIPGLTPFTQADLDRVLKVSDYPPAMRRWLAAIDFVPMTLATVRQGFTRGTIGEEEATQQLMDRGLIVQDAVNTVRTWQAQEQYRQAAPIRSFEARMHSATISELLASYEAGILDRVTFGQRLLQLGIGQQAANRAAALADARLAREELKETLTALRRAWLQGSLTAADLAGRLRSLGLSSAAQTRYLRRWIRQRGLARRMLSTGQVLHAVARGALASALAIPALANLGLHPPDIRLLLSEAEASFAQRQAADSHRTAQRAKASQREQVAALRQAESARRHLLSRLRSTTPPTALRRWLQLGIRGGQWVRDRMMLLGYDRESTDAYLSQWVMENERSPHPEAPAVEGSEKLARRQTPRGTIKSWWQNGITSDRWTRARLALLGYDHGTIERYLAEWRTTLGKKPGPRADDSPAPAPHEPGHTTGPRTVHQTPRSVHQTPRSAGDGTRQP